IEWIVKKSMIARIARSRSSRTHPISEREGPAGRSGDVARGTSFGSAESIDESPDRHCRGCRALQRKAGASLPAAARFDSQQRVTRFDHFFRVYVISAINHSLPSIMV